MSLLPVSVSVSVSGLVPPLRVIVERAREVEEGASLVAGHDRQRRRAVPARATCNSNGSGNNKGSSNDNSSRRNDGSQAAITASSNQQKHQNRSSNNGISHP